MRNLSNMNISTVQLFNNMTDEDFQYIHEAGKLNEFCTALSLDLQQKKYDERFEA